VYESHFYVETNSVDLLIEAMRQSSGPMLPFVAVEEKAVSGCKTYLNDKQPPGVGNDLDN